jgi:hypothetical protein
VIRAPSVALNPTLDRSLIDAEIARDPAVGRAEWLAEWRDDLSAYVDRELIEAAVDRDVVVRSPVPKVRYVCAIHPSGGASDAMTLAIAHAEGESVVLDALIERAPPFNPSDVTAEMARTMREYRLTECKGDRYSAGWVVQAFASHGVSYHYSDRDRSAIYADMLPLLTAGRARLLDNRKLVAQLATLERRTTPTRDRIDHPVGGHDDLANAASLALTLAARKFDQPMILSWDPVLAICSPLSSSGDTRNPALSHGAEYHGAGGSGVHRDRG